MNLNLRMMPVIASTLLLACLSTFADEPKGDLAHLQGSWTSKLGPSKDVLAHLTIKDSAVEMKVTPPGRQEITIKGKIALDEKANPKTCDWLEFTAPDGQLIGDIKLIYKLEGDTWTTCSGGQGGDRPTRFEAGEGGPPNLATWTKDKEKADEKPAKSDLDKIQGTWLAPAGPNDEVIIALTLKDKNYTAKWETGGGNKVELKGEVVVNEEPKLKTIDFIKTQRDDGEDARDNLGIYKIEGETLTICVGGAGNPRPTEFKKGDDGAQLLLVFTRKKD